jgi:hypothetical protein
LADRGRPSLYSEELATRICERLAAGETLRAICRDDDMPSEPTVRRWALETESPFSAQYAKAREIGYQGLADEILEISDDGRNDTYLLDEETGAKGVDHDVIARSRLRVDTRKWLLSKALPKVYGDKIAHVGGGDGDDPVRVITEIRRSIVDPRHQDG